MDRKKAPMASEEKYAIKSRLSNSSGQKEYAMEVYFDNALENQLLLPVNYFTRHNITKYAEQQWLPCILLVKMKQINDLGTFWNAFMLKFASTHAPVPISFSASSLSVRSRGDKGHSLFLAPVPSKPLLNFHEDFCEKLKKICVVDMEDSWVPLCPIGFDVPDDKLAQAMKLVFKVKFPLKGYVTSIGLTEFSRDARRNLFSVDLQNPPENA